jgi:hypothetical protein
VKRLTVPKFGRATRLREKAIAFIHDEDEFIPVGPTEFYRRVEPKERSFDYLDPDLVYKTRLGHEYMREHIKTLARSYDYDAYADFLRLASKGDLSVNDLKRQILKQTRASDNLDSNISASATELVAKARDVGFCMTLVFASLLAFGFNSSRVLIDPLVGWTGLIFGIGFMIMGSFPKSLTKIRRK